MQVPSGWTLGVAVASVAILAGCFGGSGGLAVPSPYDDNGATGRVLRFTISVEDIERQQVYPDPEGGDGLLVNYWAFCVRATNPNDAASVAAIERFDPLPTDAPFLDPQLRGACSVPGPTLRVQQGDRIVVTFTHQHFHAHTIHWHGQFVPWEADGAPGVTQNSTKSGEVFTYDFVAKKAGTLWYHCHVDTQLHVQQGLFGAFIVEPKDRSHEPKGVDRDYTWVLSTLNRAQMEAIPGVPLHGHPPGCNVSGTDGCQNPRWAAERDVFMINGHSYPLTMHQNQTLIKMAEGERVRLRLINVGDTFETIHPHGHDMLVTHRDGTPLASPYWVDTLTIGPAERYDVLFEANNPGIWMAHTHVNIHETNDGQTPGGMHSMIVYEGYEHLLHTFSDVLPGGRGFEAAESVPNDIRFTEEHPLFTTTQAFASTTFTVTKPCAVASIVVRARAQSDVEVLQNINELVATMRGPDGSVVTSNHGNFAGRGDPVANVTLPNDGSWVTLWDLSGKDLGSPTGGIPKNLPAGNYTVEISGRAAQARASVEVVLDYWGSFEEATIAAELSSLTACPGYSR